MVDFPGVAQTVKNCLQCRRYGFDPWLKIPWRRAQAPPSSSVWRIPRTEESGSPWGRKEGHDWATFTFTHFCLTFVENTKIAQRRVPTINKPLPPIKPHFEITIVHTFGTNFPVYLVILFYYVYFMYIIFTICIFLYMLH